MKKIFAIILLATLLVVAFAGCQGKGSDEKTTEKENVTTEAGMAEQDDKAEDASKEEITTEDQTEAADENTEEEQTVLITIYTPNENVDGLNETDIEVEELNETVLLNELVRANVIKEGTVINHFEMRTEDGKKYLILDFNEKLGELLNSYGSSGEYVTMGSIANTFLKAYEADFFQFTINGEIFESGHIIYDEPIGFSNS